jgi:transposase
VTRRRQRQHTREFKLAALARMGTAEDVQALARDLDIERGLLYRWQRTYRRDGEAALRTSGRPRSVLMAAADPIEAAETPLTLVVAATPRQDASAEPASAPGVAASAEPAPAIPLAAHDPTAAARRIADLERKIGQQALELDFFRAALRHVRELRR